MKGSLHTDELMHAVMDDKAGLRTERRISQVYLMDLPGLPAPAAGHRCGDQHRSLDWRTSATSSRTPSTWPTSCRSRRRRSPSCRPSRRSTSKLQSTIDAAALCKMADRGQIIGGVLDGPLAFDNAINQEAAREKGIVSPVAGHADILVVPDLVSGNMLAKQLTFLAHADAAGVVLGARCPIILTSRADAERTRIASCAVAVLMSGQEVLAIKPPAA